MAEKTLLEQDLERACIDFKVAPEHRDEFVLSVLESVEDSFRPRTALELGAVTAGYQQAVAECRADCTLDEDKFACAASVTADRYLAELYALARGGI